MSSKIGLFYPKGYLLLEDWQIRTVVDDYIVCSHWSKEKKSYETVLWVKKECKMKFWSETKERAARVHNVFIEMIDEIEWVKIDNH